MKIKTELLCNTNPTINGNLVSLRKEQILQNDQKVKTKSDDIQH